MPSVQRNSVRVQITLWVFLAIIASWIASSALSCLLVREEILTLRQTMLDHPELYHSAIPEPRFQLWDLLLGPQSVIPRRDALQPPPAELNRRDDAAPTDQLPHPDEQQQRIDAGPADQPSPDGVTDGQNNVQPPPQSIPPPLRPALVSRLITGWRGVLLRAIVAIFTALLFGIMLGRRFTRPLMALDQGARAYQRREFTYRIPLHGENEFTEVALAMNDMADQVAHHLAEVEEDAQRRRQLLADVAHELRGPVMTMRTMSGAMADGTAGDPARQARAVESLVRTSDRLLHLVTDLLQLAKLDLHELPIHRRQCDLREVINTGVSHQMEAAERAHITLQAELPAEPVMMNVDADRLSQVLDNLLDNAITYAGASAHVTVTMIPGNPLQLRVTDNGCGITTAHLPYIFDPFYRVDSARSAQDNHSGLGLRIARGLVEAHGGTLQLSSVEGEGTNILITMPVC